MMICKNGCSVEGPIVRGLCHRCYANWHYAMKVGKEYADKTPDPPKFLLGGGVDGLKDHLRRILVKSEGGCWLPKSSRSDSYYEISYEGRRWLLHRLTYILTQGQISDGLEIDHLCRVRNCCNPDHLEAVTSAENSRRGLCGVLHTQKTHCPYGHPLIESNTYVYRPRSKGVQRICKICALRRAQESVERKHAARS